jgi:hypothetical protein
MDVAPIFGLKEAVGLLNDQTARSDRLWNIYMAAAGFAITYGLKLEVGLPVLALSLIFVVFTLVNMGALYQTHDTINALYKGMGNDLHGNTHVNVEYSRALLKLKRAKPKQSLAFHLVWDTVVLITLWSPALYKAVK